MQENKRLSAEVKYQKARKIYHTVTAFEAEDPQQRERLQKIADKAAAYLGMAKLNVFITESSATDSLGSYEAAAFSVDLGLDPDMEDYAEHENCYVLLPKEAVERLNDDELLAYILSEKGNEKIDRLYLRYAVLISASLLIPVFLFKSFENRETPPFITVAVIVMIIIALAGLFAVNIKKLSATDRKVVLLTGSNAALLSALNKLFVDKDPQTGKPLLKARRIKERIKRIEKMNSSS